MCIRCLLTITAWRARALRGQLFNVLTKHATNSQLVALEEILGNSRLQPLNAKCLVFHDAAMENGLPEVGKSSILLAFLSFVFLAQVAELAFIAFATSVLLVPEVSTGDALMQ